MEDLNKAKEDISIQVASAYLQVLFNEELVKVANEQLALSKEMLEQKTAFYKNGKASQANGMKPRPVWHKTNYQPYRQKTTGVFRCST